MSYFVQSTKHDSHMYAKFGDLTFYEYLSLITPRINL
jgi:hypothetical protein